MTEPYTPAAPADGGPTEIGGKDPAAYFAELEQPKAPAHALDTVKLEQPADHKRAGG